MVSRSTKGTLPRVAASLKRFLSTSSKTISAPVSRAESFTISRLQSTEKPSSKCNSLRITDQIIEELDEQLTQSKSRDFGSRPRIQDLFLTLHGSENKSGGDVDDVFITTPNPSLASCSDKVSNSSQFFGKIIHFGEYFYPLFLYF